MFENACEYRFERNPFLIYYESAREWQIILFKPKTSSDILGCTVHRCRSEYCTIHKTSINLNRVRSYGKRKVIFRLLIAGVKAKDHQIFRKFHRFVTRETVFSGMLSFERVHSGRLSPKP
jgi:hypothetical protein